MTVVDTEFGCTYGSNRPAEEDTTYWRIAHFLFPFYSMIADRHPGRAHGRHRRRAGRRRALDALADGRAGPARAPTSARSSASIGPGLRAAPRARRLPAGHGGWLGKCRLNAEQGQRLPDRPRACSARSRAGTGIPGIGDQDHAVVESMGDDLRPHARSTSATPTRRHPHCDACC